METYGDPGFFKHVCGFLSGPGIAAYNDFSQVAVAQHLGLQILRLADSWILPINTTHYSIELQSYLERSAFMLFTSFPVFSTLSGSKILLRRVPSARKLISLHFVTPSRDCERPVLGSTKRKFMHSGN